jgi:DNA repair protein RadD
MSDRVWLRPYQEEALEALFAYWRANGGNPLVELATGSGKSLIIGELARRLMADRSRDRRILVITHVRELIEQDEKAIKAVWSAAPTGVYCAGLGRREYDADLCLGTIQSIYKRPELFGRRNLVVIDGVLQRRTERRKMT